MSIKEKPSLSQYLREKGVADPGLEHGHLSPNGRISKRARDEYHARLEKQYAAYAAASDEYHRLYGVDMSAADKEKRRAALRSNAAELRRLAVAGMRPRAHRRKAAELEREADNL